LQRLSAKSSSKRLCIAGGVGLNCVANSAANESGRFSELFIPFAPNDAGTAIGAALAVHFEANKFRSSGVATPYLGPQFDEGDVLLAIAAAGLVPKRSRCAENDAARMVAEGGIVGWFQGRMEFGPRALGNRSLLADPRRPEMRDILNRKIKHREGFRPFAPSILAEHANHWFNLGPCSASHEYMLFACSAKTECRDRIPAVLHKDGTGRLHLVRRDANPRLHRLLSHFFELTEVPLLLNTSLNDTEPIVCTPAHAIATFQRTGIDALFLGDLYLTAES
jgi:carbamoyltransferase